MATIAGPVAALLAVLAISACTNTGTSGASSLGETACVDAVNTNTNGRGAQVMASEASASGTRVLVLDGSGQTWTCSTTGAGVVQELSLS